MKTYRRIEVNAYRRRVTVVSGEWPRPMSEPPPAEADDGVSLQDANLCEPVAPDSPEGQLLLVEAVRSLERRLSPEARATIRAGLSAPAPDRSNPKGSYLKLQSIPQFLCPEILRLVGKEKFKCLLQTICGIKLVVMLL